MASQGTQFLSRTMLWESTEGPPPPQRGLVFTQQLRTPGLLRDPGEQFVIVRLTVAHADDLGLRALALHARYGFQAPQPFDAFLLLEGQLPPPVFLAELFRVPFEKPPTAPSNPTSGKADETNRVATDRAPAPRAGRSIPD